MLCCSLYFQGSPQTRQWECFLVFGNFSLFKTPFMRRDFLPGTELPPYLLCLFFHLLYFSYPVFEDNDLLFWVPDVLCQHSELFCRIYSALKCSFDEFVREKVVSPSYSSTILVYKFFKVNVLINLYLKICKLVFLLCVKNSLPDQRSCRSFVVF